jgi:hypothetical protein
VLPTGVLQVLQVLPTGVLQVLQVLPTGVLQVLQVLHSGTGVAGVADTPTCSRDTTQLPRSYHAATVQLPCTLPAAQRSTAPTAESSSESPRGRALAAET